MNLHSSRGSTALAIRPLNNLHDFEGLAPLKTFNTQLEEATNMTQCQNIEFFCLSCNNNPIVYLLTPDKGLKMLTSLFILNQTQNILQNILISNHLRTSSAGNYSSYDDKIVTDDVTTTDDTTSNSNDSGSTLFLLLLIFSIAGCAYLINRRQNHNSNSFFDSAADRTYPANEYTLLNPSTDNRSSIPAITQLTVFNNNQVNNNQTSSRNYSHPTKTHHEHHVHKEHKVRTLHPTPTP